ncbi:hypothetical protein OUZ56_022873 [Daphnia magna]|uniref:Uncharacterized protein n=1 Tax=Daphnia magna TaxID=35525 RepID=A0ABR0AXS5_9CRUS|nr:hypothetical protein OUZ56_022873 [Daphnia magna]
MGTLKSKLKVWWASTENAFLFDIQTLGILNFVLSFSRNDYAKWYQHCALIPPRIKLACCNFSRRKTK